MRSYCRLWAVVLAVVIGAAVAHPATAEPVTPERTAAWEDFATPEGFDTPRGIGVVNDNDVWVFGHDADEVSRSAHWDGKSWTTVPVPEFLDLATFAAKSSDDIWIGGRSKPGIDKYLAHWDGKEWTVVEPGRQYEASVNDIAFAGDEVWVSGGCCGSPGFVIRWDGTQWYEHKVPVDPPRGTENVEMLYVEGLAALDSGELIGSGGQSTENGAVVPVLVRGGKDGFVREAPPSTRMALMKRVGSVDGKTAYAAGYGTGDSPLIHRRTDQGWVDEELPKDTKCSLNAMARAGQSLYASSDGSGAECTLRLNPDNAQWEEIPFHGLDANSVWPSIVIAGSADSDTLWAFGQGGHGTQVKRYQP